MKRSWLFFTTILVVSFGVAGWAGTITYVTIPSTQSDPNCGISRSHGYTMAIDGGNTRGNDRAINGINLFSLTGAGQNTATADNCTVNALSGTLTDAGLTSKNIAADGIVRDFLSDMVFNNAGGDNSQIEIVLDPESLEQGSTYDLRVYITSSSGQNRQVNLAFFGDGQNGVETGFFNEDDARTSAGGFSSANQVYYINYRYTWDGDSTPGITVTQKFGGAPFCLYALTNELVEGEQGAAAGAGNAGEEAGPFAQGAEGEGGEDLTSATVDQESDQIGVQSDDFYGSESLNSHGRWIKLSKWGTCWQPTDVPSDWGPYTNGSWKECDDCGWTFVSDEPWAWACYHYGRWAKVSTGCGWAWVPGTVWAPSWVSWRQGKDESCVGWAPLPPEAGCDVDVGISSSWVDSTCNIGPECYTFVNIRDFGSDSYFGCGCIYERWRNPTIIIDTFNCTNICYGRHVNIYCGGPDWNRCNQRIRQLGGKECGQVYVNRYDNPNRLGGKWAKHEGNQLGLVSPKIHGTNNPRNRPKIAESVGADKIDHGWKGIKDKKQEQQLRNHIAQESKGKNPRNSPAKLPEGVAEKRKTHQGGNAQNAGQVGGGGNLRPGRKGGLQGGVQGGQGGAGQGQTGDQHPGKGKRRGQGPVAGGNAAGSRNGAQGGGGFDQHPGKNRGQLQGRKAGKGQGQLAGGAGQQGGSSQGGGRMGGHRPGQSLKKQGGAGPAGGSSAVTQGTGGGANNAGGANAGQRGGRRRGKGQSGQISNQGTGAGGQAGQANAGTEGQVEGAGGGTGKNRHRGQALSGARARGSGGQQLHTQNQGGGQGGGGGTRGRSQGGRHQQQQQQGQQQQGQQQQGQQQKQQQQQQLRQRQPQQQQQRQQQGGKRRRGQGTPPPG